MAKKSAVNRNEMVRKLVVKFAAKREALRRSPTTRACRSKIASKRA